MAQMLQGWNAAIDAFRPVLTADKPAPLAHYGSTIKDSELAEIYRRVTALADESKSVRPRDILGIAHEVIRRGASTVRAETTSAA